jgi:CubicO group peptidase (beta-lactamase class C family)
VSRPGRLLGAALALFAGTGGGALAQEPPTRVTKHAPAGAPLAPLGDPARRAAVQTAVRAVIDRAVADSAFPGAFAIVGDAAGGSVAYGAGRIDWPATAPRPDARTIWDLASLTKVVGTTSAMLQLVAAGQVDPDAPVQRYLPEWKGPNKERVRVRHLLAHVSGLPSWRPLYKEATSPESALALVLATQLDTQPDVRYVYSDLNAILLGEIARRVSGTPLDAYWRARCTVRSACATRATSRRRPSWRASRPPSSIPGGSDRRAARCTTRTPSPSAASPDTPGSSRPAPTWPASPART